LNGDFATGLMVSLVGLSITFLALGVFIGVIYLLKALFPYKPESEEGEGAEEGTEATSENDFAEEEVAAAIAAVTYLRGKSSTTNVPSRNPIWTSK
jgi:Na+-transporting methylmalonyl-CoA/oxaloacetate decarboxylase gamma subunit